MKKIKNGKLYDTDTAKCIGEYQYSHPGDFHYEYEALYVKKTGEFFLYGEGGAMSPYSKQVDTNSWTAGETIIPYTAQEAREWAEEHMDADDYLEYFTAEE